MSAFNVMTSVTVSVFDPPMCCETGVCGPGVDPALLQVVRDLRWLEGKGVTVQRYGLSREPAAFVENTRVAGLLQAFGDKALPATLVNGEVLVFGRHASREELVAAVERAEQGPALVSGCVPGSGCCG